MSMSHKVFIFDENSFQTELSQILSNALTTNQTAELVEFIEQNLTLLKDPYEGEPLDQNWKNWLDVNDPHQCGDIALTNFYDPQADIGLGDNWLKIQTILQQELGTDLIILGVYVGPENNYSTFPTGEVQFDMYQTRSLRVSTGA
jgi:hypothetical protein